MGEREGGRERQRDRQTEGDEYAFQGRFQQTDLSIIIMQYNN